MKGVSKAGYTFLRFVRAVSSYSDVYREVKPKKDRVSFLQRELKDKQDKFKFMQETISTMEQELVDMKEEYENFTTKKEQFKEMLKLIERRLTAANRLIVGLVSEQNRWNEELERLNKDNINIIGNCLLSSAFMSYLSAFPLQLRKILLYEDWLSDLKNRILVNDSFKVENQLTTDVEISVWSTEGLSQDEFAIQNGILATKGSKYPLCIDPHQQAVTWIKRKEFNNNLKIVSLKDNNYIKHLEEALKFGYPVLIQNLDEFIDPLIEKLLEIKCKRYNENPSIVLENNKITIDSNFKLYLSTKLSRPVFNPTIYTKALVINFNITIEGLEEHLLGVVVRTERMDLEEQRVLLIEEIGLNKQILSTYEDSLLRELTKSTENMLDNIELIETLESTKLRALEITRKIDEASSTAKSINLARNEYKPVAQRGALLYFVVSEMYFVNEMYQYSLASYIKLFKQSFMIPTQSEDFQYRLTGILKTITKNVYDYICLGLFSNDKLLFSFQMAIKLQQLDGKLLENELNYFVEQDCLSSNKSNCECPVKWITKKQWNDIIALSVEFPETFSAIPQHIQLHSGEWRDWYDAENPEMVDCPGEFFKETSNFQVSL